MLSLTRRTLLRAGLGCIVPAPCGTKLNLRERAAARGLLYGAAVNGKLLQSNAAYAALVVRECAIITPDLEAKWTATEPQDGHFTFGPLDQAATFARVQGLKLRLHNLVWAVYNPAWVAGAARGGRGDEILARHIATVAGHLRGQALAWDVVNEPSDPRWNGPDDLYADVWKNALGGAYFDRAFHLTHEADPTALLFVNDDTLEYADPISAGKRSAYLRLIEGAKRRGVPIHGFGLETHLRPDRVFAGRDYRRFLQDLAAMGLILHITELDICDRTLPVDLTRRDAAIASLCTSVLDTALDEPALRCIQTWGLTTADTWLNTDPTMRRPDHFSTRGLPFDADFQPTPMGSALGAALDRAVMR